MAEHHVEFVAQTTRNYVPNHRRGSDYKSTIHNLCGETITITVTNMNIQEASPTFDTPAAGALVILTGAIGTLDEAYGGWLITAGGSATGFVHIVEPG